MANFIAIIDSNAERRGRFIETVKQKLPPIAGLIVNSLAIEDFSIAWACGTSAPVTSALEKRGAAVTFGQPVSDNRQQKTDASEFMRLWSDENRRTKFFFDGFYAAVVYNIDSGLAVGADLLGVYPVYYWQTKDVLLVGSSAELFKYHPSFRWQLNAGGLVSVLLTMHIFDGQALLQGVRRLGASNMLIAEQGKPAREESQYKIRLSTERYDLPFSAHVEILGDAIEDALFRHVPRRKHCSILLSGGLDSRMLAGYLTQKDKNIDAVTIGLESDIEMKTASRVARSLGLPQSKIEVGYDEYPRCADMQAKWEHISNGFNDIFNWGLSPYFAAYGQPLIMGHILDAAVGTRYINWAYSPISKKMSFDSFFAQVNKWAIRPDILKRLLRSNIFPRELVDETINRIKNTYNNFSDLESQRAWCFNLYNRQRFHVGGSAWAISFGAWPIIPALDRKLLECAASMPAASIAERRAQTELLCSRFPQLARLPIDHNSYDTTPLRPRVRYLVKQNIFRRLGRLNNFTHRVRAEHRYYYRIYDFNNPGWKAVRKEAEPYRKKLYSLFNKNVLDEFLPAADVQAELQDKIADASGLKLLVGLTGWLKNCL